MLRRNSAKAKAAASKANASQLAAAASADGEPDYTETVWSREADIEADREAQEAASLKASFLAEQRSNHAETMKSRKRLIASAENDALTRAPSALATASTSSSNENLFSVHKLEPANNSVPAAASPRSAATPWGLDVVLESADGLKALQRFCALEQSEENLAFLLDARAFRADWPAMDGSARSERARAIKEKYLESTSALEVSLPSGVGGDFSTVDQAMFDRALAAARSSLEMDTFPRFEETDDGTTTAN